MSAKGDEKDVSKVLLHGDRDVPISLYDVSPPISVSTTFVVNEPGPYIYSRDTSPVRFRCEAIIGELEGGHALLYSSGLSAVYAAFSHFLPKRVLISDGYYGCQQIVGVFQKMIGMEKASLDVPIQKGDLVWIETPRNPDCEIRDLEDYVKRAHAVGAIVGVDATFGPPPLQYALKFGVDVVMHSVTKYYGGHSDLLGGVLIVKDKNLHEQLSKERMILGSVPGSLESWLLLRSLRTMNIRVLQQSKTAFEVAKWLESKENSKFIEKVYYPGLPSHPQHELAKRQMKGGFGAMLSIELKDEAMAQKLPQVLRILRNATSLGGVESLIDWRYKWDTKLSKKLLRVSIGLESFEEITNDFRQAFISCKANL